MARYNEILTGRINRALQKLFSMKGDAVSPQLAGEIQPAVAFPIGVEFRYLEQWNRFAISTVTAEVGGVTANKFRLRNPSGSNVVGVIERMFFSSSVVNDSLFATLGTIAGDLTTLFTPQRIDARSQASGIGGVLVPSTATSGGVDSPQLWRYLAATANQSFEQIFTEAQEITVLPGDALGASQNAVAVGTVLGVTVIWRERFLEESERF